MPRIPGDLAKIIALVPKRRVKSFIVSKDFRADGKGTVSKGSLLLKGAVDDRTKQYRPGLLDQTSSVGAVDGPVAAPDVASSF